MDAAAASKALPRLTEHYILPSNHLPFLEPDITHRSNKMNLRLWIVLAAIQFTYFASGNAVQTHTTFVAPSTLNSNIMLDL